jgi:hypothetical protein
MAGGENERSGTRLLIGGIEDNKQIDVKARRFESAQ